MPGLPISDNVRRSFFEPVDDDGYDGGQFVEEMLGGVLLKRTWAEGYKQGDFRICLNVSTGREAKKYNLVFGAVLHRSRSEYRSSGAEFHYPTAPTDCDLGDLSLNRECDCMLVRPRHSAEQSQNVISAGVVIASWVRLACAECWEKLLANAFAGHGQFPGKTVFKVVGRLPEGEVRLITALAADEVARGENSLIQGVPKVLNGVGRQTPHVCRKDVIEDELIDVQSSVRIELHDSGASVWLREEGFPHGGEVGGLFRSP